MASNTMSIISYPNHVAALGGAVSVKHNAHSAWIQLTDRTIRMPLRLVKHLLEDGMATAEEARKYAYRNL